MNIEINISANELKDLISERVKSSLNILGGEILEVKENINWTDQEFEGFTIGVRLDEPRD